jgi:hypothetical protein
LQVAADGARETMQGIDRKNFDMRKVYFLKNTLKSAQKTVAGTPSAENKRWGGIECIGINGKSLKVLYTAGLKWGSRATT